MGLPASIAVEAEVVRLSGGEVKHRSLTVRETRRIQAIKDEETADVVCIATACDLDEAEVKAWISTASPGDLNALIKSIFRSSGVGPGATFPGAAGDDAGAERPA